MIKSHEYHSDTSELKSALERDIRLIDEQSTITITNEYLINEFISRLEKQEQENWADFHTYGITWADIDKVAKEMGVIRDEID
jgi:hypothetical protein